MLWLPMRISGDQEIPIRTPVNADLRIIMSFAPYISFTGRLLFKEVYCFQYYKRQFPLGCSTSFASLWLDI